MKRRLALASAAEDLATYRRRKPLVKRHQLHQPSSKRQRFEMAVEKYKQSILADGGLVVAEEGLVVAW